MMKRVIFIVTFGVLISAGLIFSGAYSHTASAYSKSNQISAETFGNYTSMSQTQIQNFINKFPNSCLLAKNYPSGLSSVTFKEPLSYWNYGSNTSPARIIWNASQFYKINPQVLLTTLEKENTFVSGGGGCQAWRYNSAMGYDCTESNSQADYADIGIYNTCVGHEGNAGFSPQVNHAAWQLSFDAHRANGDLAWMDDGASTYSGRMTKGWRARKVGAELIYYDGYTVINGESVYLENGPTAALYNYTPHFTSFDTIFTQWFGSPTGKYNFKFEQLVGSQPGSIIDSTSTSLGSSTKTLTYGKNIYTFYYDATNKNLHLAQWNGTKWSDRLLDGTGATTPGASSHDVGKGVDAVIWNGQVQVYYYDSTGGDLRHAWTSKTGWRTETMDGSLSSLGKSNANVGSSSKVLLYKGNLQLYYYNQTDGSLRHAWWPGDGHWHFENIDGTSNSLGKDTSDMGAMTEALIYKDGLQLYYYNQTDGSLRHAWWPGDGHWHFENIDGTSNSLGKDTSDMGKDISATLYNGNLQLYYYDRTHGELKHAWWPADGRWHFETMDGDAASSVFRNDINAGSQIIAKQFKKDLFIFYYDDSTGFSDGRTSAWRAAYWDGSWHQFVLDGSTSSQSGSTTPVGGQLSLGIYQDSSVQVFYQDTTGGLTHAWVNK